MSLEGTQARVQACGLPRACAPQCAPRLMSCVPLRVPAGVFANNPSSAALKQGLDGMRDLVVN